MAKVKVNWGPADSDCSVRLFQVYNTAHKPLDVLARDEARAMSVAWTANHVYDLEMKHADNYSRYAYEVRSPNARLANHWSHIQEAIAQRLEGTVHLEDDSISVGDQLVASVL